MKPFLTIIILFSLLAPHVHADTNNPALIQKLLAQIAVLQAELNRLLAIQGTAPSCTFTRLLKQGVQGQDVTCLQNFLKSKGHFTSTPTGLFGPATEQAVSVWQRAEGIVAEPWEYGHFGEQSRVVYARSIVSVKSPVSAPISPEVPKAVPAISGAEDTTAPTTPGIPVASVITDTRIMITWASSTDNIGVYRYRVYRGTIQTGVTKTNSYTASNLSPDTRYTFSVAAYDKDQNFSQKSLEITVRTLVASSSLTIAPSSTPATTPAPVSTVPATPPYNPAQVSVLPVTIIPISATTFYVDGVSGNDANLGTTQATAWKTLAKVSSVSFPAGSNVFFKKGQTFYGALIVNKGGTAGNPITFGAYGSGAKPVISGFYGVINWNSFGGNIWESIDPVSTLISATVVTVGGENTPMGRYPNDRYHTYESFVGNTAITSSALRGGENWTGAELVLKKARWVIDRNLITAHSGNTLTYAAKGYQGQEGWGFFIQNDPRTLDQKNEWYFNPQTKKLRIYSRTKPTDVQVSSVDTLVTINTKPFVTIDGLAFEGGNNTAVYVGASNDVTIKNSSIDFSYDGIVGLGGGSSANFMLQKSALNNTQNNGITLNSNFTNAEISENLVQNTGMLPGMGGTDNGKYFGMQISGAGTRIDHNRVINTGYAGIYFNGDDIVVSNNLIDRFCMVKDDGAGIYTNGASGPSRTGQKIINNIVINGIGNDDGVARAGPSEAEGIYLDESVENIEVSNNSVAYSTHTGIYLHNNKGNNIVRNNTVYDTPIGFWIKNDGRNPSVLRNLTATNNIFFAKEQTQIPVHMATAFNDIRDFGTVDNNYYVRPTEDSQLVVGQLLGDKTTRYTLSEWQTYSGFDTHSTGLPIKTSVYRLNNLIGSNLYPNGQFVIDKNNFQVWSPTANTTLEWDGTNKITGAGSVQIIPQVSKTDYALITGSLGSVVPVSSSKNYILRFTTVGTTETGSLRAQLRRMDTPYTNLTPLQSATFGTAKKTHEFLFTAPVTDDAATFVIQFREDSGNTFIDDIEFYEADVTVGGPLLSRFEYNASDVSKTVSLDGTYFDARDQSYSGSITILPWSSVAIYKKPGVVSRLPSMVPLTNAHLQSSLSDLRKQLKALQAELKKLKKQG